MRQSCSLLKKSDHAFPTLDDVCPALSSSRVARGFDLLKASFRELGLGQSLLSCGRRALFLGDLIPRLRCRRLARRRLDGAGSGSLGSSWFFAVRVQRDEECTSEEPGAMASFHVLTKPRS